MKDFLGNELNVGDEVVCETTYYKGLQRSKIKYFTKTKIRMEDNSLKYPLNVVKIVNNGAQSV